LRIARPTHCGALIAVLLLLSGCAQTGGPPLSDQQRDPIEPFNRSMFWFNEQVDQYFLEPVAKGWDFVMPEIVQEGLENFFENLRMPVVIANDILQLKPRAVGEDLLRLYVNSVYGLGGFIDFTERAGITKNDEGFGQTLGYWGVPAGPYLVVPFLGPATPRSLVGMGGDAMGAIYPWFAPFWVSFVVRGVDLVNLRAKYLEEIDQNRAEAFDYYIFVRNAFLQNQEKRATDATDLEPETQDDLYYFDEDDQTE